MGQIILGGDVFGVIFFFVELFADITPRSHYAAALNLKYFFSNRMK